MKKSLLEQAKNVLDNNFQLEVLQFQVKVYILFNGNGFRFYINWIMLHYDIDKAKKEITSILSAQWKNGFIPSYCFS